MASEHNARRTIYDSRRWKLVSRAAMVRDDWTCRVCGHRDPESRGGTLDAHHLERVLELADPYDLRLVEVLCDRCHGGTRIAARRR